MNSLLYLKCVNFCELSAQRIENQLYLANKYLLEFVMKIKLDNM